MRRWRNAVNKELCSWKIMNFYGQMKNPPLCTEELNWVRWGIYSYFRMRALLMRDDIRKVINFRSFNPLNCYFISFPNYPWSTISLVRRQWFNFTSDTYGHIHTNKGDTTWNATTCIALERPEYKTCKSRGLCFMILYYVVLERNDYTGNFYSSASFQWGIGRFMLLILAIEL